MPWRLLVCQWIYAEPGDEFFAKIAVELELASAQPAVHGALGRATPRRLAQGEDWTGQAHCRFTQARPQYILMRSEPARVLEIALDRGFGDVSNFNRVFRSELRHEPSQFSQRPGTAACRKVRPRANAQTEIQ